MAEYICENKNKPANRYINPSVKTILEEIRQEYCLKRNNFNPKGSSPNIFVSKLRWRMKTYYKDLYNSFNVETK